MTLARLIVRILPFTLLCVAQALLAAPADEASTSERPRPSRPNDGYPKLAWYFAVTDPNSKGVGYHQCNPTMDVGSADKGKWIVPKLLVNTDNDWGGCQFGLTIQDPDEYFGQRGFLHTYVLISAKNMNPSMDDRQCSDYGPTRLPVTRAVGRYFGGGLGSRFDTDEKRPGPCRITLTIPATVKVRIALSVSLEPSAEADKSQCSASWDGAQGTVTPGNSIWFEINTDGIRPGGCLLSFKLDYE